METQFTRRHHSLQAIWQILKDRACSNLPAGDYDRRKRATTLLGASGAASVLATVLSFLLLLDASVVFALPGIVLSILSLLSLFLLLVVGQQRAALYVFLFATSTMLPGGVFIFEGIISEPGVACLVYPIIAFLLAGRSMGIVLSLSMFGVLALLYASFGISDQLIMRDPTIATHLPAAYFFTYTFSALVAYVYESHQAEAMHHLEQSRAVAREALESKARYLARITHDMRTPINGILGFSELMQDDDLPNIRERATKQIEKSANVLLELVNNIVDLARIEAGKFVIRPSPFKVREFLQELEDMCQGFMQDRGNQIAIRYQGTNDEIVSDKMRIRQILLNLIGNANKFTKKGMVEVTAEVAAKQLHLTVRDTGMGMPKDQLAKIREDFYQIEGPGMRQVTGSGLGLSIVYELTSLLGGELSVDSSESGTVFDIHIPVGVNDVVAMPESAALTALVVDDDSDIRDVIKLALEEAGYHVVEAENGMAGLSLYKEKKIDLVVSDMYMPHMNGLQMAEAILAHHPEAKVIIVSGSRVSEEQLNRVGVLRFFRMPFDHSIVRFLNEFAADHNGQDEDSREAPKQAGGSR